MSDEALVTAEVLEQRGILPKWSAYRLARLGLIPCFTVGAKHRGVRFRVSEVVEALRKPGFTAGDGSRPKHQEGVC